MVTGLWHGAAWTFILWGVFHGLFNILEKALSRRGLLQKIPTILRWAATMLIVMLGWVLFRADSLMHAWTFIKAMFGFSSATAIQYQLSRFYNAKVILITGIGIICAGNIFLPEGVRRFMNESSVGSLLSWVLLFAMLIFSLMIAMTSTYASFIYFQF